MHILIDKERMVFLRKHQSVKVLCDLAWIESHESPVALFECDASRPLTAFTELELATLYFNTTSVEWSYANKYSALVQVIWDLMQRLPADDINAFEAEAQAAKIKDDTKHSYQFVKGSTTPVQKRGLFEPEGRSIARNENEELMALRGVTPAYTAAISKRNTTTNIQTSEPPAGVVPAAPKAPSVPHAPKLASVPKAPTPVAASSSGSKKDIIWGTVQKLWEEAGKPQDNSLILKIRKTAMDILEKDYAISRTSASSSMAGWQKQLPSG